MSLVLLYFDEGPLQPLVGKLGSVFFNEVEIAVKRGDATLASHALAICHNWSSGPFRLSYDPPLHRDLLRLIARRLAAGRAPHLVFHWFEENESTIEAAGPVETRVRDAENLHEILHATPNDTVLRITGVDDPMGVSVPALIAERQAEGDLPELDGILFGDGAVVLMDHRVDAVSGGTETTVRALARATLESFLDYNQNRWVTVTPLASCRSETEGVSVTAGEGGFETDGFVTVRAIADESLRWAAYFRDSGSFQSVTLDERSVVAVSATGHRWRFPLDQPDRLTVDPPPAKSPSGS